MFPLNAVLFPGVSVPLDVFEDRYRALVHHLLRVEDPAERVFGSVGDPRGLRGRRPRRAVAVPRRLPGPADRGRGAPRRHLRHRRGRAGADRARAARDRRHRSRSATSWTGPRRRATCPTTSSTGRGRPSRPTGRRWPRSAPTRTPARCPRTRRTSPGRWPRVRPAAAAGAAVAARGRGRRRAADPGHRPAARRAARDERDPVAAGHRGGPHPLVARTERGAARMARKAARRRRRPRSR